MPRFTVPLLLLLLAAPVQAEDLLQAYELSLRNDPKVAADRAAYEAALQAKPLARALLLPQVSAGAELSKNRDEILASSSPITTPGVARYDASGYRVSLSQTLFNWSQFAQLRQADAQLFSAEATLAAATQEQIIRVATRYFDVLAAEDSLRTAQAEKTAIASQLQRARRRFEVGMSPILDVQETQARYDTAVAQEIEARRLLRSAREALRAVTGRYPETLAGLRETLPLNPPEPQDAESWVRTAAQNNLQVQNAQALSDVARSEVQKQTGGHYPSLNLVGSYDYFDRLDSPFGGREQESSVLGLQLAIPIYAGGGVQAGVRQAARTHEQRLAELELARREVERQTRDAYDGVVVGISRVEALAQALKSNRTALETTEAGYRVGARTVTDTLDAQSALYRAERDYARARYDYLLNTLLLKQSTGQLSAADLKAVNALLAAAPAAKPQPTGVTPAAPGYPPGVIVAPEKPIKLEQPLPETPAPAAPPPAPAPAPAPPRSAP
jgi:outer membrane protein